MRFEWETYMCTWLQMVPSENILNFYICKNFACITEFLETMSFKLKPQGCKWGMYWRINDQGSLSPQENTDSSHYLGCLLELDYNSLLLKVPYDLDIIEKIIWNWDGNDFSPVKNHGSKRCYAIYGDKKKKMCECSYSTVSHALCKISVPSKLWLLIP